MQKPYFWQMNLIRISFVFLLVLTVGLFVAKAAGFFQPDKEDKHLFNQRVNLALRQTADRLLDLEGNHTQTIPPVKQPRDYEYLLNMQSNFNYDSLPPFLRDALHQYRLDGNYYVAVTECRADSFVLGYSKTDLSAGIPPCVGREQKFGCYNLTLIFPSMQKKPFNAWDWSLGLSSLSLFLLSIFYYNKRKEKRTAEVPAASGWNFGESVLDLDNLKLFIKGAPQSLTFREAKLLHYFIQHPNQLLSREAILGAVWEDEGIIVGRSLDVFVSRLRKILRPDSCVKIVNVHGIGYRIELITEK